MRSCSRALVLVLALAGMVFGSTFDVEYNSSADRTVIWIEAEDYDAKTAEFVVDSDAYNVSGSALYFAQDSDKTDMQQWWSEYSIDSATINDPNVSLSGNWYCWVRVNQPELGAEEATFLIVKGDSGDGSGTDWYETAFAGLDDGDDILNNDIAGNGGAGFGAWTWMGGSDAVNGVEKEFNLDIEGKIVFRINERESNENSGRIDAICWTDDATFVPSDAAFGRVSISDGLVLELNAAYAGNNALSQFMPVVAGEFGELATGEFGDPSPTLKRIDGSESGSYIWYYEFDGNVAENICPINELKFGADEEYTVETWVRVPAMQSDSAGRGVIIGNADAADTGWRFGVRNNSGAGKYFIEFNVRDNETVVTPLKSGFYMSDTHNQDYDADNWIQLVGTRHTVEVDTFTGNLKTEFSMWINGVLVRSHTTKTATGMTAVDDFALDTSTMSAKVGPAALYPFTGDIALIRVYNRALTTEDVLANYNRGLETAVASQCGGVMNDLTGDCMVNLSDFSSMASTWLNNGMVDGQ